VVELPTLGQQSDLSVVIKTRWEALCQRHGRRLELEPAMLAQFARYPWPGNWPELEHCLEAALLGAEPEASALTLEMLSLRWQRKLQGYRSVPCLPVHAVAIELRDLERAHMEQALESYGGNYTAAAKSLGISRSTLYRRLGSWGLSRR
tara:strand:- start:622 stop:1068 length:447 start_codon:yes stop_codon:yes gene_type:complete